MGDNHSHPIHEYAALSSFSTGSSSASSSSSSASSSGPKDNKRDDNKKTNKRPDKEKEKKTEKPSPVDPNIPPVDYKLDDIAKKWNLTTLAVTPWEPSPSLSSKPDILKDDDVSKKESRPMSPDAFDLLDSQPPPPSSPSPPGGLRLQTFNLQESKITTESKLINLQDESKKKIIVPTVNATFQEIKTPQTSIEFAILCSYSDRLPFDRFPGFAALYGLPLYQIQDQNKNGGAGGGGGPRVDSGDPRVVIPETGIYSINWGGEWDDLNVALRIATLPAKGLSEDSRQSVFQSRALYWPISPTPKPQDVQQGRAKIQPVELQLVKGDYVWVDAQRAMFTRNDKGEVVVGHISAAFFYIRCFFRVRRIK